MGNPLQGNILLSKCLWELLYSCALMLLKEIYISSVCVQEPTSGTSTHVMFVFKKNKMKIRKKACKTNDKQTRRSGNRWCGFGCSLQKTCCEESSSGGLPNWRICFLIYNFFFPTQNIYTIAHECKKKFELGAASQNLKVAHAKKRKSVELRQKIVPEDTIQTSTTFFFFYIRAWKLRV